MHLGILLYVAVHGKVSTRTIMAHGSDILVVGGGAVGAAVARALAVRGATVALLRPSPQPGEGWSSAAGMLAAQIESAAEDPLFNLGVAGRAFYQREAERLVSSTGIDISLAMTGILQVARSAEQVEVAKARVAWQRQQSQQADWLEPDEIREGWPWLDPGVGGFWAAGDGALDPGRLVEAFLADAVAHRATVVTDRAVSLITRSGKLLGVHGEQGDHEAGTVVIAAGAWSGRIAGLPRPLSVEPVRGQMMAFRWPDGIPPATVYGDRCYVVARGVEMIAGSTMEYAGFDLEAAPEPLARLRQRLAALYPALRDTRPLREWRGFRPGTPDGRPIIGAEPLMPGLWYATGHGRHGILWAGITGELIARAIGGEALPEELRAVRPGRFWPI